MRNTVVLVLALSALGLASVVPRAFKDTTILEQPVLKESANGNRIVCYFTNWAWYRPGDGKFTPDNIDSSLCTHVMYAFATLSDGQIKPYDSWADIDNKFYEKVVALKNKGIKVAISIGGWNDSAGTKYHEMAATAASRKKFIDSVVAFCQTYGFQGIGLDWEYPGCPQGVCNDMYADDKQNFAALVTEMSAALTPLGLYISAAVSPSAKIIDFGLDVPTLNEHLEWFDVMAFDYHGAFDGKTGQGSPIYGYPGDGTPTFNMNYTVNYLLGKGVSKSKLVVGMPLYGHSFTLPDPSQHGLNVPASAGTAGPFTRQAGVLAYYEICAYVNQGWTVVQDDQHRMGPYAYHGNQWVSWDDVGSLELKAQYVLDHGLAGAMIWDLAYDDFHNRCGAGANPLLTAIKRKLL